MNYPCSGFGLKLRRDNARLNLKIKIENYSSLLIEEVAGIY
jgi:hypothetical protein